MSTNTYNIEIKPLTAEPKVINSASRQDIIEQVNDYLGQVLPANTAGTMNIVLMAYEHTSTLIDPLTP